MQSLRRADAFSAIALLPTEDLMKCDRPSSISEFESHVGKEDRPGVRDTVMKAEPFAGKETAQIVDG
jgi:hypothetical protein